MPKKGEDKGTGVKLVDGCHVSSVTFQSMFYAKVTNYLIEVCVTTTKAAICPMITGHLCA